ncbi:fumarylacetoacetate hydrolase family protein [Nocardioides hwasunensis]|uniref:Fumarylacetoacetate hydrolase family protein n=1 Tax=Nocardioides hwasunensis TaxID=397258 RepID=A0ABR8MHX2_9ACTN|nr:fumarylacetoacetate hydrolase family protein [Nocardioides hwasunensis]
MATTLPADAADATLVGRVMTAAGPAVVTVRDERLVDLTGSFATTSELAEHPDPAAAVRAADGPDLGSLADVLARTPVELRSDDGVRLLSPIDLQAVKAAGVTFAVSMVERVIEERCQGDAARAEEMRAQITGLIGADLGELTPGSPETDRLKEALVAAGSWSQYLEVGLGPDAEIFTKTTTMASVGTGVDVGIHPRSQWNNPEPEVVVLVSSTGSIRGATLGNDVNLRDFEGRSALLLGKAKDNNASAALGPFVRLFDDGFSLDDVRRIEVGLDVVGTDGFHLTGSSSMSLISRDPADLVGQLMGPTHQYPDGAVLFLGTMFAPVQDRDAVGQGFTHHVDDLVAVTAERLGGLVNRVRTSEACEPWTFGAGALMRNLASRGLLTG